MSIKYLNIARGVALRANQLKGGDSAAREASYASASFSAQIDGIDVPYSALKQNILTAESEIWALIANSRSSIYRANGMKRSDELNSGDEIPFDDGDGGLFMGVWDGVFDADTDKPLSEQPKQIVLNRIENPGEFFKIPAYHYHIEGTMIFHTVDAVYLRGVSFDMEDAEARFDDQPDGISYLPPELETLWMAKVLSQLPREGWFVPEAGFYADIVASKQSELIEGKMRMMQMPDMPSSRSRATPAED